MAEMAIVSPEGAGVKMAVHSGMSLTFFPLRQSSSDVLF